ncbi:dihydrofolate reductase family protein [Sciscionella marina]|uniref:dihydrofolate reductase family protein n=1 Tax=Sciscionella marina TaxID=508770 RepID=UPI0003774973|nr:dihydrofolate reductase family protein [Sciscionella marina]
MARLIYCSFASLDGYIADENGDFGWAVPDAQVHAFANELQRGAGTHLYGRRLYEAMTAWETDPSLAGQSSEAHDFAQDWQAADKIVYSRTLGSPVTARTRIEREFTAEPVRELKATSGRDLIIGGAELAAHALHAGLVDECQVFVCPMVVGAGKRYLPARLRTRLELLEQRCFGNGMVYLRYRVTGS